MTTVIVNVDHSSSVLEAARIMREKDITGVVVVQKGKPVGMMTERSLLRRFVLLNGRPGDVKVGEIMGPLLKVDADDSTTDAAKKLLQNRITRLGVFDNDKMVGWVTLADLSGEATKKHLLDFLRRHHELEPVELLCPVCRMGVLNKTVDKEGNVLRWECSKCGHVE